MIDLVILGATGFVGSSVSQHAEDLNLVWKGVSRRSGTDANIVSCYNTTELERILAGRPIVINASGSLKPKDFINDFKLPVEEFWSNFMYVEELLRKYPPRRFIQISSAGTIYGESNRPAKETDISFPKSWYGRMKKIEESLFFSLSSDLGISFACARVTNPFGNKNALNHGFIDVLINKANASEEFVASFAEGACRDFIYAPTMARYLIALAMSDECGTFNIGSGISLNLDEILSTVGRLAPKVKISKNVALTSEVVSNKVSVEKVINTFPSIQQELSAINYIKQKLKT